GMPVSIKEVDLKVGMPLKRMEFRNADEAVDWLSQNPSVYAEVTIETESYLDGQTRKKLADAHDYIVDVIPKRIGEDSTEEKEQYVDPKQDMEALFNEYFRFKNGGMEPSESILSIFREVVSQTKEDES
ncbi:MAG: hypothetical protein ACO29O_09815, partial [Chitinophagaceae bacterium]